MKDRHRGNMHDGSCWYILHNRRKWHSYQDPRQSSLGGAHEPLHSRRKLLYLAHASKQARRRLQVARRQTTVQHVVDEWVLRCCRRQRSSRQAHACQHMPSLDQGVTCTLLKSCLASLCEVVKGTPALWSPTTGITTTTPYALAANYTRSGGQCMLVYGGPLSCWTCHACPACTSSKDAQDSSAAMQTA